MPRLTSVGGSELSGSEPQPHSSQSSNTPPAPPAFTSTPNAERHLLEADALRRRQLRASVLHGSHRGWRERLTVWPAAMAGTLLVAVIVAAIAVAGAFAKQQRINQEQQQKSNPSATASQPQLQSPSPSQSSPLSQSSPPSPDRGSEQPSR